jgi:hypothetical protein
MMFKKVALTLVLAVVSASASAGHCPMDMKQIDEALSAQPQLSAEQLAQVKQLRAEGEAFHKAGKHQESVASLGKAKSILGL